MTERDRYARMKREQLDAALRDYVRGRELTLDQQLAYIRSAALNTEDLRALVRACAVGQRRDD